MNISGIVLSTLFVAQTVPAPVDRESEAHHPVLVRRYATDDSVLDLIHAAAVADLAMRVYGAVPLGDDEFGQRFRFPTREQCDAFQDHVEETTPIYPGAVERWRDVVLDADTLVPGGRLHGSFVPPSDDHFDQQWAFELHRIQESWAKLPDTVTPVVVAVLDTGIDPDHPDLHPHVADGAKNFTSALSDEDDNGHGTHVAGVIAALTGNGKGIAGASPTLPPGQTPIVAVLPLKVWRFAGDPQTDAKTISEAIDYAVEQGVHAITLAFNVKEGASVLDDAISLAVDNRVVVVASAGDADVVDVQDGQYLPSAAELGSPADHVDVLTVGGLRGHEGADLFNFKAPGSNWGPQVDVGAHGNLVWSTTKNGTYQQLSGTSAAAGFAVALSGLVKSLVPLADADRVRSFITANAYPSIGNNGGTLELPSKHGTIDFEGTIIDALDKQPNVEFCPGLPPSAPFKVQAIKDYKKQYSLTFPGSSPQGEKVNLKDDDDQCGALYHVLAKDDGLAFLMTSASVNNKQQCAVQYRFVTTDFPAGPMTVRLQGTLDSDDDKPREVQVRYYNFDKKGWSKAIHAVVTDGGAFAADFALTSNVLAHIKSPQGVIRCRVRVRHAETVSKVVPFRMSLDRVRLITN